MDKKDDKKISEKRSRFTYNSIKRDFPSAFVTTS